MNHIASRQAPFQQLLDHFLQVSIVYHQLVELLLVQIAATASLLAPTEGARAAKTRHLLLHLSLDLLKARVLQQF